jgi:hypothetical protein
LDYANMAKKAGSGQVAVSGAPQKGGKVHRLNHPPGLGKNGAQHGQQALWQAERRKEAEARNTAWAALDFSQKIKVLDLRLGKVQGAVKQRARIAAALVKIIKADEAVKAATKPMMIKTPVGKQQPNPSHPLLK